MNKRRICLLIALLIWMFMMPASAEVIMITPEEPYDTVYALLGEVIFGWLDLQTSASVVVRDEADTIIFEDEVLPGSMKTACSSDKFEEGKLYSFELTVGKKVIRYPFYVSFEREAGIGAVMINMENHSGEFAYLGNRMNALLSELRREDTVYSSPISEYMFLTRQENTLLHSQVLCMNSAGLGEKGNLEVQKLYLTLIMSAGCKAYEDAQAFNSVNDKKRGIPFDQELGKEFELLADSYLQFYVSDTVEYKYLLNKKVKDYADVLLFALVDRKTGVLLEDAVYMLTSVALKGEWTNVCLDADQEVIEEYLRQYHNTSKAELLIKAGVAPVVSGSDEMAQSGVIGRVLVREGSPVHVRDQGNADGKRIGRAYGATMYDCVGVAPSGWYKIRLEDGSEGYISNKLAAWIQHEDQSGN